MASITDGGILDSELYQSAKKGDIEALRGVLVCIDGRERAVRSLRTQMDSQEKRDELLRNAAKRGHTEAVRVLLEGRADPYVQDRYGNTALHHAVACAQEGCTEMVKALLEGRSDLARVPRVEQLPELESPENSSPGVRRVFAEFPGLRMPLFVHTTVLNIPLKNGDVEICRALLEANPALAHDPIREWAYATETGSETFRETPLAAITELLVVLLDSQNFAFINIFPAGIISSLTSIRKMIVEVKRSSLVDAMALALPAKLVLDIVADYTEEEHGPSVAPPHRS